MTFFLHLFKMLEYNTTLQLCVQVGGPSHVYIKRDNNDDSDKDKEVKTSLYTSVLAKYSTFQWYL